jgi:UDP-3-O-[3-hydroxymyristoyl] N-acetylglucosamine deacetylase
MTNQHTLGASFELSGVGLHSGVVTHVRVLPAIASSGRYFVRIDLPGSDIIPARVQSVKSTTLSTELACGEASVRTVEHLLASLAASGVDNARIEIDGPEVPLLDGSAACWAEAIARSGVVSQEALRQELDLKEPVVVYQGDAYVAAIPAPSTRFTYEIDFDVSAIGNQWHSWSPEKESFASAIAPARTFALAHQIDQLRAAGLIKGGSLDNALVCGSEGWLNPPLRFSNEPVRHKLLDLVGDLSLLGSFPKASVTAYKASHNLHVQFTQRVLDLGF